MAASRSRVRIVVADIHAIVREGLQMLLQAEPGFRVIGEAVDGAEAVHLVNTLEPDVLSLDVAMPRLGGLATLRELASASVSGRKEIAQTVVASTLICRGRVVRIEPPNDEDPRAAVAATIGGCEVLRGQANDPRRI